jgi:outer membrane usher protein
MKRRTVAGVCCVWLLAASMPCWGADPGLTAATPIKGETIVIRATLNTEGKGDLFVERTPDRDFLVKAHDLKAIGFRDPRGTVAMVEGEVHISLRSIPGVSFTFNEKELTLDISAPPQLLISQEITLDVQRRAPAVPSGQNSLFVNYSLNSTDGDSMTRRSGFAGELGWRVGNFLFLTEGNTTQSPDGKRQFVRLMSSITHDDRSELRRTVVGDFFTPTREFSNGVNLGGVSITKLYGLNPYFVQYPMQSISGNVALPSDLEVYVGGQRIRTERLKPGEFELRDILAYGGARDVQLVLRDAFGRVQQLNYSFYFSDQPLRRGLHEYSYNLGAMRRSYGSESNRYGPAAFSMFHRYGLSEGFTLGVRAEGTKDLLNAGPLATVVLGSAGVVSLAAAASSIAGQRGAAGLASYTYQSKNWAIGASLRRDWKRYAGLSDFISVSNRKHEGSVSGSYYMGQAGTVSLSHSFLAIQDGFSASSPTPAQPFAVSLLEKRRISALNYSVPLLSGRAVLTASLSHIKDHTRGSRNEGFLGINIFVDKDYSVAASYRGDRDFKTEYLEFNRRQPVAEGLGYTINADRSSNADKDDGRLRANFQYNAPAAILRAEFTRDRHQQGTSDEYRAFVAGGVGYVDGTLSMGRPITGSFGVVKIGEMRGVAVLVNSERIGETDVDGKLFLPSLSAYVDNEVSIAPETVPIEYSISSISQKISPSYRSGTVINFPLTKLQAFTGKLKTSRHEGTKSVEFAEISLSLGSLSRLLQTGRGGEFYIENLKPGTYAATVRVEGKPCLFDIVIPTSDETFVELGDVMCRFSP